MGTKPSLRLDFNNMMAETIGPEHGITAQDLKELESIASGYAKKLKEERAQGKLQFLDLPYDKNTLTEILETAQAFRGKFKNLVVMGIGGSALGNTAIHTALNHPFYNVLDDKERAGCPRIYVLDNVDPDRFAGLMDVVKPEETLYNFITKSGATVETMSQFLIITRLLRGKLGKDYREHVITTTDSEKGVLREITRSEGFKSFAIPAGVGGRYSVLTPVGLFSAAMSGVDVAALLSGAAVMDEACRSDALWENPALMGAALHFLSHTKKGKNILIMMPYSHALGGAAEWFCQLWAESLGKKTSLDHKTVHAGSTPVKAVGVVDQHSQLQLYMEGPYDKVINFCEVKRFQKTVEIIPASSADKEAGELAYLKGHALNDLMKAEFEGTRLALTEQNRPNCTVSLDELSASTLGQFFSFFELQTAYAGKFYNVNAFDQPGVEAGKINAFAMLGKKGCEQRKGEIEARLQRTQKRYFL